jgi:hypothetical protein
VSYQDSKLAGATRQVGVCAPNFSDDVRAARMEGSPVWLMLEPEPVYAVLHSPGGSAHSDTAVIILPTFGWDEACSYRARREWAIALADAGFVTARIDLPGSEDSVGSPLAPGRMHSWLDAVGDTARWLLDESGCSRIAAIGLGLGGLLAVQATCSGAPIDDLVLWAVPARGRTYLRELRVYANVMTGSLQAEKEPERADGAIGLGGYLVSAETADAIAAVDLTQLSMPDAASRRIMLIDRDTNGVDERLKKHLVEEGASVVVAPATDYERMMTFPDASRVPRDTIQRSIAWLCERAGSDDAAQAPTRSALVSDAITFEYEGRRITERHVECDTAIGRLVGILSEPADVRPAPLCLVSANAGALRRTSPGRMWTELCRQSAANGIPALRLDLEGVGDSDGHFIRRAERTAADEQRIVFSHIAFHDLLQRDGVADRFATIGLCLGAYWQFRVARSDTRVVGSVLINPAAFEWTAEQTRDRDRRLALKPLQNLIPRLRTKRRPSPAGVLRAIRAVVQTVRGVGVAAEQSQLASITDAFDGFAASNTQIVLMFSQLEPLLDQLDRLGLLESHDRWPNIAIERLPTRDHHLCPLVIQDLVLARIHETLENLMR